MRDAGSADRGPGYASTMPTSWTCPPSRSRPRAAGGPALAGPHANAGSPSD